MRRLKSFLCVLSACALVMSLSGCGGDSSTQSGDEVVWIMAHTVTEDIALHKAFVQVAENIKEATDGKFVIEIYPNSLMGGNREVLEGMQFDTFQMTMPNVGMLGGYSDQISVLELPYLMRTSLILKMLTPSIIPIFSSPSTMTWRTPASCGLALGIRETAI